MPHSGPALEQPVQLSKLLQLGLKIHANEPALISLEDTWSWADLEETSSRLAANYLTLGLKPGDRVASLMPNCPVVLAHYLACFKAGLIATPLNYRSGVPEIDHVLDLSGATLLISHVARGADIAASKARNLPLGILSYGEEAAEPSLERLSKGQSPALSLPALDVSAPAAIFFTSGSTGPAKGVTHSVASLGAMFASMAAAYELTQADTMLPAASFSHIGAFAFSFAALSAGTKVAVPGALNHAELGPLFRLSRPTVMTMMPTGLLHLVRDPETTVEDFASLRLVRSGGDKVPGELQKEFMALTGQPVHQTFGMTELGIATHNPAPLDKLGSIGLPNPGVVFSIRDENGREVADGEQGQAWIRAACTTIGYWNNAKATEEAIRDGWLDTGDAMKADSDGYLWFCGRQKQLIVHDGAHIVPQEVEEALLEHPAVESVGVIGVHDLVHGENVRAYVEIKAGMKTPSIIDLIEFASARLGYKAPDEIVFLDKVPLNLIGKVDRVALKTLAAGEHAHHV